MDQRKTALSVRFEGDKGRWRGGGRSTGSSRAWTCSPLLPAASQNDSPASRDLEGRLSGRAATLRVQSKPSRAAPMSTAGSTEGGVGAGAFHSARRATASDCMDEPPLFWMSTSPSPPQSSHLGASKPV